jgi:signal transduction histidine kinase
MALRIRELLGCDYALVAVPENDSIRIQAIAGDQPDQPVNLAADVISRLRDWGPVVVDDARMIAVPVRRGNEIVGILVGYSREPGTFTTGDLRTLLDYSNIAAEVLPIVPGQTRTTFTMDELLHFSRLITIGELSACFAHEVTNPLTLIRGHLRFVQDSLPSDHPVRLNLDVIDRASSRIEEMARRMLDFSRKRRQRMEPCDVAEIVSDALRFVQPYTRPHFPEIQLHLQPGLPALRADRWQIVQALVNLVQNATDAMALVETRVLTIAARTEGTQLVITISDTGTGVAATDIDRIFDPFFTTKGERGTGLGLYITKQVIDGHKGTIKFQSDRRGTSFVISLPL